jgi:ubiquinone biosynthesis protein
MRNLRRLARLGDLLGLAGETSLREFLDEFAAYTGRELDFVHEGHTADRIRRQATAGEVVPRVCWHYTTAKVLTLEFIDAVSMAEIIAAVESGGTERLRQQFPWLDIDQVLGNLATSAFHQFYITGLFHADPHPGNILVLKDNRVAFVDFGITGELSDSLRTTILNYIENLGLGQVNTAFRYLKQLFIAGPDADLRSFEREIKPILNRWLEASRHPELACPAERLASRVADETLVVVRHRRMRMDLDVLLYWRAITVLDSTVLRASPTFDYLRVLKAFLVQERPGLSARLVEVLTDERRTLALVELLRQFPGRTEAALNQRCWQAINSTVEESSGATAVANANSLLVTAALLSTSLAVLLVHYWRSRN